MLEGSFFPKRYWSGERSESRRDGGGYSAEGTSECVNCLLSDRFSSSELLDTVLGVDTVRMRLLRNSDGEGGSGGERTGALTCGDPMGDIEEGEEKGDSEGEFRLVGDGRELPCAR